MWPHFNMQALRSLYLQRIDKNDIFDFLVETTTTSTPPTPPPTTTTTTTTTVTVYATH